MNVIRTIRDYSKRYRIEYVTFIYPGREFKMAYFDGVAYVEGNGQPVMKVYIKMKSNVHTQKETTKD